MDDDAIKRIEDRLSRIESLLMTMTPQTTKTTATVVCETPIKGRGGWKRRTADPMWSPDDEEAEMCQVRKRIIFACKECQNFYEETGHELTACRHAAPKKSAKKKRLEKEREDEREFWELGGFESEETTPLKFQHTPPFSQETF